MLLESHTRMPSSLLQAYVQYKQDTRAIIAWLLSHGPKKYQCLKTLKIQDLFDLASHVQEQTRPVPSVVLFHFREAIKARTHLTRTFRRADIKDDRSDYNHEYFTNRLTELYTSLCRCEASGDSRHPQKITQEPYKRPCNPFAVLHVSEETVVDASEREDFHQHVRMSDKRQAVPHLDDGLGAAFELRRGVEDMNGILAAVQETWTRVAQGQTSMVLAALVTGAAYSAFEDTEQRLKTICSVCDPGNLRQRYCEIAASQDSDTLLVENLNRCWALLRNLKKGGPRAQPTTKLTIRKDHHANCADIDQECHTAMLHDIAQHIQQGQVCNRIICGGSPVYAEVGYFLTHADDGCNSLRCTFGLQLLLSSYKSYFFAQQDHPTASRCRLETLQFAQNALESIQSVLAHATMPCRCHGTLAYHLENLQADFQSFIRVRMFNFYFQSPWTCASHLLEMLDALFYYGLRLFHYRSYVASVMHVYNILLQFTDMSRIPLLDHVATSFDALLFPGGRPKRSFRICYTRYMGGRLRFHTHNAHRSGCHSIAIPAHTARTTAGFGSRNDITSDPRFDTRKVSLLYHVKEHSCNLSTATWTRIHRLARHDHGCGYLNRSFDDVCPATRLENLQTAVYRTDFSGPFPRASIDLLKVYLVCAQVVSDISDVYHGMAARPGQYCLCSVEALLAAADRCRDNAHLLEPLGCKGLVKICRDAIEERLANVDLDQFQWRSPSIKMQ